METTNRTLAAPAANRPAWRRLNKDRVSAVVLVVLGVAIVARAWDYRLGTLTRMGAGFVPTVLGVVLALAGVAIGLTASPGDFGDARSDHLEWRGWLCVIGGVFAFVVLGTHGGLVPASFVAVFIAAMGDRGNSVKTALLLAAGITLAGVLIFSVGLKMTFPLFTWG